MCIGWKKQDDLTEFGDRIATIKVKKNRAPPSLWHKDRNLHDDDWKDESCRKQDGKTKLGIKMKEKTMGSGRDQMSTSSLEDEISLIP